MIFNTKHSTILHEMERLERLAENIKLAKYKSIGGNDPRQSDYSLALKETLDAYIRLARKIEKEDAE